MTVVVPNALALAGIIDGSSIVASDHRNNYAAAQVGVNGLIAMFTNAPTKGDLIVSAGGGSFDKLGVGTNGQAIVADSTQPLGVKWATAGGTTYRKTTAKAVNTTVAATDLLNGEITIGAGAMGTTGITRLTTWGDGVQNSGGAAAPPRFQLVFGGTTLLDTGTSGTMTNSALRFDWGIEVTIANENATNVQWARLKLFLSATGGITANAGNAFTTGVGAYSSTSVAAPGPFFASGGGAGAKDTTGALALVLNVINGSASASYETKLVGAVVEVIA